MKELNTNFKNDLLTPLISLKVICVISGLNFIPSIGNRNPLPTT